MALTLLDIAAASTKQMQRGIIEKIIETSPFLSMVPFENTGGNLTFEFAIEGTLPTAEFRALNTGYNDKESAFNRSTIQLKPFGGQIVIDRKLANQPNFDGQSSATRQLEMLSRAISLDIKKNMFTGDASSDPREFDGYRKLIRERATLDTGVNLIYNSNTSGEKLSAGGPTVMIEQTNRLIDAVLEVPDLLVTNRTILSTFQAQTATGNNSALAQFFEYGVIDIGGRKQRGGMWQGIPMIAIDDDSQGTAILAFDQAESSFTSATEIYAIKFGDPYSKMIQDLDGPETSVFDESNGRTWVLDWAVALLAEHPKSVARLTGILAE